MIKQKFVLPQGWEETKLDEVVSSVKGKKPTNMSKKSEKGYLPYLLIDELEGKQIRNYTNDVLCPVANKSDVLIVWDGSIGKIAIGLTGVIGSTITALSPIIIESKYLFNYLLFKQPIIQNSPRGSGLGHIDPTVFWNMDFPLCSLNEQKRIVSTIEELFSKINSTKQSLEYTKPQLVQYRQSLLKSAFEGKLTEKWRERHNPTKSDEVIKSWIITRNLQYENGCKLSKTKNKPKLPEMKFFENTNIPKSWSYSTIENLASFVIDCPHSTPKFIKEGEFCIDTTCIKNSKILWDEIRKITKEEFLTRISRMPLLENDIIFSREGTIGTTVLVPKGKKLCLGQRVMMFRFPEFIIPKYAEYLLQSPNFKQQYNSRGGTATHINVTDIRKFFISIPTIEEQEQIVSQIEHNFSLIENTNQIINSTLQQLDAMKMSILKQAFEGKLVPQDPNDEPASVLLERIQKEKIKT